MKSAHEHKSAFRCTRQMYGENGRERWGEKTKESVAVTEIHTTIRLQTTLQEHAALHTPNSRAAIIEQAVQPATVQTVGSQHQYNNK